MGLEGGVVVTVHGNAAHALMRKPMARRKFSIRISVFFTSDEKTSEPTMGQNGTCAKATVACPEHTAHCVEHEDQ